MRIRASLFANPELPRTAAAALKRNQSGVTPARKFAPKRKTNTGPNPAVSMRQVGKGAVLLAPANGRRLVKAPAQS